MVEGRYKPAVPVGPPPMSLTSLGVRGCAYVSDDDGAVKPKAVDVVAEVADLVLNTASDSHPGSMAVETAQHTV